MKILMSSLKSAPLSRSWSLVCNFSIQHADDIKGDIKTSVQLYPVHLCENPNDQTYTFNPFCNFLISIHSPWAALLFEHSSTRKKIMISSKTDNYTHVHR